VALLFLKVAVWNDDRAVSDRTHTRYYDLPVCSISSGAVRTRFVALSTIDRCTHGEVATNKMLLQLSRLHSLPCRHSPGTQRGSKATNWR
jgi:hypothetical protein